MQRRLSRTGVGIAAVLLIAFACSRESDEGQGGATSGAGSPTAPNGDDPPYAQRFQVDGLRAARDAPIHASDGGGRAWLEDDAPVLAGTIGRWTIHYEAGPEGVAVGGLVILQIPLFWKWSRGQMGQPDGLGYVTAETDVEGVELKTDIFRDYQVIVEIQGRPLAEGERLSIRYGAGPRGARTDIYAERGSPFWVTVDGDGDGSGAVLEDSPTIDVLPGPPAQLHLSMPSTAQPGDEVDVRVALLDRYGNAGAPFVGEVEFLRIAEGFEIADRVRIEAADLGRTKVTAKISGEGVHRLFALAVPDEMPVGAGEDFEGWLGESNPLEASERAPRILWADLHGHTNLTDGTGTPEDFFVYARDVAGLDVVSLTDHDHWGTLKLDAHPELWDGIVTATREANAPGEFVTLLGFEWTSWIHGHRHVVYFGDEGPILSSVDEAYESPLDLWAGLRAQSTPALTFAHHSAGGPIPNNWDIAPDPEFEPVTEISSVHGVSEAADSPSRIYSPVPGNFVRDALDRGYRLGFVASGDSHDGHPGLAHLASPNGGLAAILSEDLTREGVLNALRERRAYATNGRRIVLRCALGTARMGQSLAAPDPADGPQLLFVHVIGTAQLVTIEVIRSGKIVQTIDCEGAWDFSTALDVADLQAGEYVYVRVEQADHGLAWSSPFFVE